MPENMTDRVDSVRAVLAETGSDTEAVRIAALRALVPVPDQGAANSIWKMLVGGLLVLVAIALVGLLVMVGDGDTKTSPDLVLTAFSSLLTGLLGLFIRSPVQSSQTPSTN